MLLCIKFIVIRQLNATVMASKSDDQQDYFLHLITDYIVCKQNSVEDMPVKDMFPCILMQFAGLTHPMIAEV